MNKLLLTALLLTVYSLLVSGCTRELNTLTAEPLKTGNSDNLDYYADGFLLDFAPNYGGYNSRSVDLDGDGEQDLIFDNYYSTSYGSRMSNVLIVNDNLEIHVSVHSDSIFRCYSNTGGDESTIYFNRASNLVCAGTETFSSLAEIEIPTAFEPGETLPENWVNPERYLLLSARNTSGSSTYDPYTGNSTYSGNDILHRGWDSLGSKYLVFRLVTGEQVRYGWLQLQISNFGVIRVSGWAVQPMIPNPGI